MVSKKAVDGNAELPNCHFKYLLIVVIGINEKAFHGLKFWHEVLELYGLDETAVIFEAPITNTDHTLSNLSRKVNLSNGQALLVLTAKC